MRRGSRTLAATFAALLLAVGPVACGGDDDASSTTEQGGGSASGKPATGSGEPAGSEGVGTQRSDSGDGGGDEPAGGNADDFVPKAHSDSGGGATQYRVKGGDNSVQEFGEEASEAEFEAAAAALHDFLDARAEGNWDATCRYLSKSTVESFEQLAARSKSLPKSCGAVLEAITNPAAEKSLREEAAKADVGSLRTEGDEAFLIYTAGGDTILAMPMVQEDGGWKVAGLAGTPLN